MSAWRNWAAMHQLARRHPTAALRLLMRDLSDLDTPHVIETMSPTQRQAAAELIQTLRSSRGFLNDLHPAAPGDPTRIQAPTLIVHSSNDASVPLHHPTTLADQIPAAQTLISPAESHLVWFSNHYEQIEDAITAFLTDLTNTTRQE